MNTIADMGGMHGFGAVDGNTDPFHAEWERRVLGLTFATLGAGLYNVDEIRRVTENIRPDRYLAMSYFERLLETAEVLLAEKNVFGSDELAGRNADAGNLPAVAAERVPVVTAARVPAVTAEIADQIVRFGGTSRMAEGPAALFRQGDAVRARNIHPAHHTRLVRYVRGKCGVIDIDHGIFALPDTNSRGAGLKPQHVYGVRFKARDLWGLQANPNDTVQIDLFDDYLEPA